MKIFASLKKLHRSQLGISLVETLVAVVILGTSVVTFVAALSTGSIAVGAHEQDTIAQRLAQNQIEYTKNRPFSLAGIYPVITAPSGYTITINTYPVAGTDTSLQKITVTVLRDGSSIFIVSDYKANR
jgi:Tfp pilus assembly protein PilV